MKIVAPHGVAFLIFFVGVVMQGGYAIAAPGAVTGRIYNVGMNAGAAEIRIVINEEDVIDITPGMEGTCFASGGVVGATQINNIRFYSLLLVNDGSDQYRALLSNALIAASLKRIAQVWFESSNCNVGNINVGYE
ncbi:MAG: hypothetical protein HY609_03940 [Deltaproteobacteria bacterium]|nr:hypothetical protein [Deltaproteobacteria bacterium]MBI4224060.1 hypothetical protein [Deltaproteobacteria bacterium]